MKKYLLVSVVVTLTLAGFTTSNSEPLRKCSFYEIMNDEDEDGLVQNPKDGPSVCAYTQDDLAAAKKDPRPSDVIQDQAINAAPSAPKVGGTILQIDPKKQELVRPR